MALDDKDIFQAIFARYPDQPIEFIMCQYEKARLLNKKIQNRLQPAQQAISGTVAETGVVEETVSPAKKKYTKRNLKVKPKDSITEDAIFCCICGESRQTITAKHLATHDITVEDYKKLCGYPEDQSLMSAKRLAGAQKNIARAQASRLAKKAAEKMN